ncbi:MAG: type II toxin-antitoxin system VapC family toxin [Rhodocyclaceae bacterium]
MKPLVYLETSVVSYLAARPSRDLIVAAHQQITAQWWDQRENWTLYASRLVVAEAAGGDADAAARRIQLLQGIAHLALTPEAEALVEQLMKVAALPATALEDAFHIGLAIAHGMDFLVTWNCTHIANASKRNLIAKVANSAGYVMPVICTPEELLGENNVDRSDCR